MQGCIRTVRHVYRSQPDVQQCVSLRAREPIKLLVKEKAPEIKSVRKKPKPLV